MSPRPGAKVAKIGSSCSTTLLPADHHAVAALRAPDRRRWFPRRHSGSSWVQVPCTLDVIDVIRIAAIDQDVVRIESWQQVGNRFSTVAAGTINQTARGLLRSFWTRSFSEELPTAFS